MPKISVIVPVYMAENYLEKCINSILSQTFRDFELILINDGSNDKSGEICDQYRKKDERIKVIHQNNRGIAATRNTGLESAVGEYIAFVDSDDYADSMLFELMYNKAKLNNSDIVMCNYNLVDGDNISPVKLKYNTVYDGNKSVREQLLYRYYTDDNNGLAPLWNKLLKRKLYIENAIRFDTNLKRGEDSRFIFCCLKFAERVDFIEDYLYFYCVHSNSIMHKVQTDQYEKWVYGWKILLEENKTLKFTLDYNKFYSDFLCAVLSYCRSLLTTEYACKVKEILNDDFFITASKYHKTLPLYYKVILNMISRNHINLAIYGLKLLNRIR